jgi:hypothetical protein
MRFFETSAKSSTNVSEAFYDLTNDMIINVGFIDDNLHGFILRKPSDVRDKSQYCKWLEYEKYYT